MGTALDPVGKYRVMIEGLVNGGRDEIDKV
jgi:hypothetical protein